MSSCPSEYIDDKAIFNNCSHPKLFRKTMLKLHPDKNLSCKEEADKKTKLCLKFRDEYRDGSHDGSPDGSPDGSHDESHDGSVTKSRDGSGDAIPDFDSVKRDPDNPNYDDVFQWLALQYIDVIKDAKRMGLVETGDEHPLSGRRKSPRKSSRKSPVRRRKSPVRRKSPRKTSRKSPRKSPVIRKSSFGNCY